uniref:Integrase-like protein n=1 Tax=Tetrahymena thermophila TaxID=5911 RepID=Q9GTY4_TETTH|nr:integrase-like protein [Tetrahymena thermophila]
MQQEIINAYQENFTSANDIYKKLNKKYTLKQIKDVLKNIDTNQIIGKKQENKDLEIPISAPQGSFQADLTFYEQFKRQNHGYSILLTIIEINTRFAYVFPLKDKSAQSILECLKELYRTEKDNFRSISSDEGSEFDNNLVKNFLDQHNIKYIFFNKQTNPNATSLIERFNRTIRDKISKYQSFHKQKNFIDELQKLVKTYNNTIHSQINMTPQKAKEKNFSNFTARQQKYTTLQKIEETFQINDFVRVFRKKKQFEKGQKNYTKNIYQIVAKDGNNFILQKFKDGKLQDKQIEKTAAYLQKVNISTLFSKQKTKKEISKKEVKKQTNLSKKLKREGIDLKNIIPDNKYLPPEQIHQEIEQLKKEKQEAIQLRNQLYVNLERDKDEEIEEKDEKQKYLTFYHNMKLLLKDFTDQLNAILNSKINTRKQFLEFNNYLIDDIQLDEKEQPFNLKKKQGKQLKKAIHQRKDQIKAQTEQIDEYIKNLEKSKLQIQEENEKIKNLEIFYADLVDNYSLDEDNMESCIEKFNSLFEPHQKRQQEPQVEERKDPEKKEAEKVQEQSIFDYNDSEYFKKHELKKYDNEIQINEKISELEEAIQVNRDFDDIENQIRVQEYQEMIKLLKEKLNSLKNKKQEKPKRKNIIETSFLNNNDEEESQNIFEYFNQIGKN